ncbi:MAG TPA: PEGA domain-containing protein [Terriglobales bacterium]|nr:PEGA domain-containing protein [Terriglobales bacterium]
MEDAPGFFAQTMIGRMIRPLIAVLLLGAAFAHAQAGAPPSPASTDLILQDGTAIKLRVAKDVSWANAKVGDTVSFEAAEDVRVGGLTIIRQGSPAFGIVTFVQSARRMARPGKLAIAVSSVQLADGETARLRRSSKTTGEERKGEMTAEVLFGFGPLQLFEEGEDAFLETDTIISAYVNGAMPLDQEKFKAAPAPAPSTMARLWITSHPAAAEIAVDGNVVGSTPSEIQLTPGQHTIRISKAGCRTWERTVTLSSGKSAMNADLYPAEIKLR